MAKIDVYGGPKVRTQVARQPTLSTPRLADTAGIIGGSLNKLTAAVRTTQDQLTDTRAEEALVEFEREKNDLFFNPESGYFNTQGRNAYDGAKSTSEALAALQNKYADGFDSPIAREKFMKSSQVHLMRGQESIMKHSATGLRDYESATIAARVENSIESAAFYFSDDNELQLQNTIGRQSIVDKAEMEGLGSQATAELLQSYESQFVATTINAALSNNQLNRANELMGRFGNRLEPAEASVVAKNLSKANFDMDVHSTVSKIVGNGGKTLTEMVNQVDEIDTSTPEGAELKTEVMRMVKNRYSLEKTLREEAQRDTYENYGKQIQDGEISTSDIPGTAWDAMTITQRSAIKKLEKDRATGANVVTDDVYFSDILLLPPKELAKVTPHEHFDKVGGSDRDKLVSAVKAARKAETESSSTKSVRSRTATTKATLEQIIGKKTTKYNDEDRLRANAFYRMVNVAVEQQETAKGSDLTPLEFDNLLNAQTRKFVQEWSFGFLSGESQVGFDDVPPEYIDEITEALVMEGEEITGENIARRYVKAKEAGVID